MNKYFNTFFIDGVLGGAIVRNGIPRFTQDITYSTGNFSKLREKHADLQLDSHNQTNDRLNTLLERTGWPASFFDGKNILECGCGAGPDTEILLQLGARVLAVDLAGLDIAKGNLGKFDTFQLVQASIMDLPLKKDSFDIVICHRVIQHTPDPEQTLRHILQFVKQDGDVFVHSYAHTFYQMFRWKYLLLPITRKINPESLYGLIKFLSKPLFHITNYSRRFGKIGSYFAWVFIPFLNYRYAAKFKSKSDNFIIDFAVHDTFDALSPTFDKPIKANVMRNIASKLLNKSFEIVEGRSITLLRTKPLI